MARWHRCWEISEMPSRPLSCKAASRWGLLVRSWASSERLRATCRFAQPVKWPIWLDWVSRWEAADAASLEAVGTTQQNQNQRNLDLAYQDFQQQRDYPRQQLDWLSNIIRGIPNSAIPTSTTSSQTGPSQVYQPSPLAQVGSLLTGIRGISALGQGT